MLKIILFLLLPFLVQAQVQKFELPQKDSSSFSSAQFSIEELTNFFRAGGAGNGGSSVAVHLKASMINGLQKLYQLGKIDKETFQALEEFAREVKIFKTEKELCTQEKIESHKVCFELINFEDQEVIIFNEKNWVNTFWAFQNATAVHELFSIKGLENADYLYSVEVLIDFFNQSGYQNLSSTKVVANEDGSFSFYSPRKPYGDKIYKIVRKYGWNFEPDHQTGLCRNLGFENHLYTLSEAFPESTEMAIFDIHGNFKKIAKKKVAISKIVCANDHKLIFKSEPHRQNPDGSFTIVRPQLSYGENIYYVIPLFKNYKKIYSAHTAHLCQALGYDKYLTHKLVDSRSKDLSIMFISRLKFKKDIDYTIDDLLINTRFAFSEPTSESFYNWHNFEITCYRESEYRENSVITKFK